MKNKLLILLVTLALIGCGKKGQKIDYLPVEVECGDGYGFVNAKGEVFFEGEYDFEPSAVIDGVFFADEGGTKVMYKFDKKKPKVLLEDIKEHGIVSEGLVPVVFKNGCIDIVKTSGKVKFTLDKSVLACFNHFEHGYLVILQKSNGSDDVKFGAVNTSGKVVLPAKYDFLAALDKDLFVCLSNNSEALFFINSKGEKQKQWPDNIEDLVLLGDYIAFEKNNKVYIYDLKGNEVLKCPNKVQRVIGYEKNGLFTFFGDDRGMGVMNLKGETVMSAKYNDIILTDNGILAKKGGKPYSLYNTKGELISKLEYEDISAPQFDGMPLNMRDGFPLIAQESRGSNEDLIIDENFKALNKIGFCEIEDGKLRNDDPINSDYTDFDLIVSEIIGDMEKGCYAGNNVTECDLIKSQEVSSFGKYKKNFTTTLHSGIGYETKVTINCNNTIIKPVYTTKNQRVQVSAYYSVNTQTKVVDHYELNSEAIISECSFTVAMSDAEKAKSLYEQANKLFDKKYKKSGGSNTYVVKTTSGGEFKCSIEVVYDNVNFVVHEQDNEGNEYIDSDAQKQLEAILNAVAKHYNEAFDNVNCDEFCSSDWNNVRKQVEKYDEKYDEMGYVGYFDYDIWIQCQDFENVLFENVKITKLEDKRAHAKYTIVNIGQKTKMEVDLVLENDKWLIDDFFTNNGKKSLKADMKKYMLEE